MKKYKNNEEAAKAYADLVVNDTSTKQQEFQHEATCLDFIAGANWKEEQLKSSNVIVSLDIIKQVLKYCEDNQTYDKLGGYQDFYYKLNQIRRDFEDANTY